MSIQVKEYGVCYWVGNHHGTYEVTEILDTALRISDQSQGWYRVSQMPLYKINGHLYGPAQLTPPSDADKAAEKSRTDKLEAQSKLDAARMRALALGLSEADIKALAVQS